MGHPFENSDQLEGNALNVGGYVGVDPRFQTDPKVFEQDSPFVENGPADDEPVEDEDVPAVKAPVKKVTAPSVPAPGDK